ncbi:MAG: hypothetical protein AB7F32_03865 [Victivallaceae bacterium]
MREIDQLVEWVKRQLGCGLGVVVILTAGIGFYLLVAAILRRRSWPAMRRCAKVPTISRPGPIWNRPGLCSGIEIRPACAIVPDGFHARVSATTGAARIFLLKK